MKLVHSKIEKSDRTNPIHEQSKFVRGIKAIGRELSGFAGVAVLATGISTVLLFSSCGSSSTTNPTPKIEDVSIQNHSQDSDASSYLSYCPDKDKRVYGNGPDPITTLQIGDKINLDENNYLEFAGVNAEGKAVFNIKSKSTNDLVGLVVLGQGEQKTITSADGSTMLILEACTVGIDSVTVGANTKLDPYSTQGGDISQDKDVVSYETTDVPLDYSYEVEVTEDTMEAEAGSSCAPPKEWCEGVTAVLNREEILELPDCEGVQLDDVETAFGWAAGNNAAVFTLFSEGDYPVAYFKVLEGESEINLNPDSGEKYEITVVEAAAGYTLLSTWVTVTVKPYDVAGCEGQTGEPHYIGFYPGAYPPGFCFEEWCNGVTGTLDKGESLLLPSPGVAGICYKLRFDDISKEMVGSEGMIIPPSALISFINSGKKAKIPEGTTKIVVDEETGKGYEVTANTVAAGYTLLTTWVNLTVKPNSPECKED